MEKPTGQEIRLRTSCDVTITRANANVKLMITNNFKTILSLLLVSSLLGCKANEVEVSISKKDIEKAMSGENISVVFDANLDLMAQNDEEMRGTIQSIATVTENYLTIEEFELTTGDFGLNIDVEGEIPLIYIEDIREIKNIKIAIDPGLPKFCGNVLEKKKQKEQKKMKK